MSRPPGYNRMVVFSNTDCTKLEEYNALTAGCNRMVVFSSTDCTKLAEYNTLKAGY
jgi:hypothetical protein